MTNNVGLLYQNVIKAVIRDSRTEVEAFGEDEQLLYLLQNEWQLRLSAMRVSNNLPWDLEAAGQGLSGMAPGIGREPLYYNGYDSNLLQLPNIGGSIGNGVPGVAASGPVYMKEEDYGSDQAGAGAQPSAASSMAPAENTNNTATGGPADAGVGMGRPAQPANSNRSIPQYQQGSEAGTQEDTVASQVEADLVLPQLPQQDGLVLDESLVAQISTAMGRHLPQTDGGAQGDEVNSDLDESEDELNSDKEGDDADLGTIMLCLYDKVQRVKNKWKYVLKDGMAKINGQDYVFSRATGESEW